MLKVNVVRGLRSRYSGYDYIMVSGGPEDIAGLIESLSRQFAGYVRSGSEGQRAEPRFEGSMGADGDEKVLLSGYISISLIPEMQCAHPDCRETFAFPGKPAAAFRQSGLVCEKHEGEAHLVRPKDVP
jgi:hypothetical protein